MWHAGELFQERSREPRLADACLAREKHHLTFAGLCLRPASQQQFKFFLPPDERGQCRPVQRLKAALNRAWPHRSPRSHQLSDALEVLGSQVLQLEQIAEQFSCALGDDDRVRLGDALQSCSEVWCLTDDAALLRLSRSDQIADNDQPGGDADASLKWSTGTSSSPPLDQLQPRPHRPLGVVLMGLRDSRNTRARRRPCTSQRTRRSGCTVSATHF